MVSALDSPLRAWGSTACHNPTPRSYSTGTQGTHVQQKPSKLKGDKRAEGHLNVVLDGQPGTRTKQSEDLHEQLLRSCTTPTPATVVPGTTTASQLSAEPPAAGTDLSQNVTQLTLELSNLAKQVASLVMDSAHLSGQVQKLKEEKSQASGQLMQLSQLSQDGQKLANIGQQLLELEQNDQRLHNKLEELVNERSQVEAFLQQMARNITLFENKLVQMCKENSGLYTSWRGVEKENQYVQGKVEQLQGGLSGLGQRLDKLGEEVARLQGQPNAAADLASQLRQLGASSADLARQMQSLSSDTQQLGQDHKMVAGQVGELDKQVQQLTREQGSLSGTAHRLSQSESATDKRLTSLTQDVANVNVQLQSINHGASMVSQQVASLASDAGNLSQLVNSLGQETSSLRTDVARMQQEETAIKQDIINLEHKNSSMYSQLQQMKAEESSQNTQLQQLHHDQTSINRELSTLKSNDMNQGVELSTIKSELGSLSSNLSHLASQISQLQYNVNSNYHGTLSSSAAGKVSFHAVGTQVQRLPHDSVLVFNEVQNNHGSGYEANTGQFVAPYDGTYCFMASAETGGASSAQDVNLGLELRVDGSKVVDQAYASHKAGAENQSASMHAIVSLKAGQRVAVFTTVDSVFTTGPAAAAFSGFLLF